MFGSVGLNTSNAYYAYKPVAPIQPQQLYSVAPISPINPEAVSGAELGAGEQDKFTPSTPGEDLINNQMISIQDYVKNNMDAKFAGNPLFKNRNSSSECFTFGTMPGDPGRANMLNRRVA